jgi:hypothetical protein
MPPPDFVVHDQPVVWSRACVAIVAEGLAR